MNNEIALRGTVDFKFPFSVRRGRFLIIVWALLFAWAVVLSLSYIFQINMEVKERYILAESEIKLEQLLKENKIREIAAVRENSLEKVSAMVSELNFEKTDTIRYIRVLENQAVLK